MITEPVTLSITFEPNGKLTVNGPIDNKVLCYGILELARDVIQQRAKITLPTPVEAARLGGH